MLVRPAHNDEDEFLDKLDLDKSFHAAPDKPPPTLEEQMALEAELDKLTDVYVQDEKDLKYHQHKEDLDVKQTDDREEKEAEDLARRAAYVAENEKLKQNKPSDLYKKARERFLANFGLVSPKA